MGFSVFWHPWIAESFLILIGHGFTQIVAGYFSLWDVEPGNEIRGLRSLRGEINKKCLLA